MEHDQLAFPSAHMKTPDGGTVLAPGMTLRDWFAGQALPAVMSATAAGQHHPQKFTGETTIVQAMAFDAYAMADAMLATRTESSK